MNAQLMTIKSKKLGIRLASHRQKKGYSHETVSQWINIPVDMYEKIEKGLLAPTLPQLEIIADHLNIPFAELVQGEISITSPASVDAAYLSNYFGLQNRLVGMNLKKARIEKNLSVEEVAEQCGLTPLDLEQNEKGLSPIPFPILENLCEFLGINPTSLLKEHQAPAKEESGPTSEPAAQPAPAIPGEYAEFVTNPANAPYLELAKRLSTFDAAKLRSIAEGLLEITY